MILKKHLLRASLLLIVVAAGFLCAYAVWKVPGSTAPVQSQGSQVRPQNSFPGASSRLADRPGQMPGGQLASPGPARQPMPFRAGMPGGAASTGAGYASQLIAYALLFAILFVAVFLLYRYKRWKINPGDAAILILTLLCAGLLLRIAAATLIAGHPFDINTFKSWATAAANNLPTFYANPRPSDYPPLYIYVLFVIGKIASIPAISPYGTLLLKLPSIAADIATSYLIYRLAKKYLTLETSTILAAFYIFNPAVLINSTIWGQVDSFFTLIVLSAVVMLAEHKIGWAAALFAAAVMMKPQGIIFLPVLFFELIRQKSLINWLKVILSALSTAAVIILPFSLNRGVLWIFQLFATAVSEYPYASVNAFNFFGLLGANYTRDATTLFVLSYHSWGLIFIVTITALAWFIYIKGNNSAFAAAAALLLIAGVFTFATGMHERYLFPAVALSMLAFIYLRDSRLLLLPLGFSATVYINTHYVLVATMKGINAMPYNPVLIITATLNLLLFAYLAKVLLEIANVASLTRSKGD